MLFSNNPNKLIKFRIIRKAGLKYAIKYQIYKKKCISISNSKNI